MTKNLPSNDDLLKQLERERESEMTSKGIERFKKQLGKAERDRDLSRSKAGKAMDKFHLQEIVDYIDDFLTHKSGRQTAQSLKAREAYRRLSKTPLLDLKTGEQQKTPKGNGRTFNPWNTEQVAIIILRGMIDVCRMPIIDMNDPAPKRSNGLDRSPS